jgi:hypothetical protein
VGSDASEEVQEEEEMSAAGNGFGERNSYEYGWLTFGETDCKHYDREEINLILDGKTPPITRCKTCGATLGFGKRKAGGETR